MKHIYGIQFFDENANKFGSTIIFTNRKKAIKFALRRKSLNYATKVWFLKYEEDSTEKWNDGALFAHIKETKELW